MAQSAIFAGFSPSAGSKDHWNRPSIYHHKRWTDWNGRRTSKGTPLLLGVMAVSVTGLKEMTEAERQEFQSEEAVICGWLTFKPGAKKC